MLSLLPEFSHDLNGLRARESLTHAMQVGTRRCLTGFDFNEMSQCFFGALFLAQHEVDFVAFLISNGMQFDPLRLDVVNVLHMFM